MRDTVWVLSRSRWVLIAVVIVLAAVAGALWYARPLLLTATGYAAHNACAVELVAGRDAQAPAEDLPPNPLIPLLRTDVDAADGTATSSLVGMFGQTAYYAPELGCTLADQRPSLAAPIPVEEPPVDQEWPQGQQVNPPPQSMDTAAIQQAVDRAFAENDPEGRQRGTRAVVVVHEGRIVAERYADGFDADTPQLGWSMAKSVTNAIAGRLVDQGVIAVADASLLPAWDGDPRADITIDDLLRMTPGLEWDETYALGSTITEMLYLESDMGGFTAAQPLAHDVGGYQQYSSGTTNLLCDVLHQRSGTGEELGTETVFRPLGMASAVLEPDTTGGLVCSSYLWATPRDWARFGLWFAQNGEWEGQQLLPPDWVDYSTSTIDIEGEEEGYGAHWWVNRRTDESLVMPDVRADAFWASGHDGQRVFVIPSADLVVVRMGFTPEIDSGELGFEQLLTDLIGAVTP